MPQHGGALTQYLAAPSSVREHSPASGFCHLFGPPDSTQRFRIYGKDPLGSSENQVLLRRLMRKLSLRMDADIEWPPHDDPAVRAWENPNLPSGYTYLLQIVSHDLVQTTIPVATLGNWAPEIVNARRAGLALDTIYGDGPVACPFAYVPDSGRDRSRTKLRLGRIQRDDRTTDKACPFRDIARVSVESEGAADVGKSRRQALSDPLIVDPRNDDHAILSQMATLFALLHNGLIDLVSRSDQNDRSADARASHRRFLTARAITSLLYRRVVREDLMRRLLHPSIYELYSVDSPRFLHSDEITNSANSSAGSAWKVPLEFSHGVFRFGHSLVRDEYRINDFATNDLLENLQKTSLTDAINMPLNESWVVQWSRFFSINGSKPNLSRRIGPNFSSGLSSERIFPSIDESGRVGLAYRDLMSSALPGLWSLRPLIEEVRKRRPELIRGSRILEDHAFRARQISEWLLSRSLFGGLQGQDIETLARDPPLSFFFLWEAASEPGADGLRLGRLGSIIVAEVIFGALARFPTREENLGDSLRASMSDDDLSCELQGSSILHDAREIASMSELILFAADLSCLKDAKPAFV